MPRIRFSTWQRATGGLVGVLLLAFALTYHFFPNLLNSHPDQGSANAPVRTQSIDGRVASPGRSLHPAEINAGPPIALAPRSVLERRTRERIDAAMQAIAVPSSAPSKPASALVRQLLTRADKALEQGNLAGRPDSAASLYTQALAAQRDNRKAARGLAEVHVKLATRIQQHLEQGETDAAERELQDLKRLPGTDQDVAHLQRDLERQQALQPLLAQAAKLLQDGKLLGPQQPNALNLYRKILARDPGNSVATNGLERIQRKVLDQALGAVAGGDFRSAETRLASAAGILPGSAALRETRKRIADIRLQQAGNLLAQAHTALDSGNLTLAASLKSKALAMSPDVPGIEAFDRQMENARLYANFRPGQVFRDAFLDISGHSPRMVVIPTGKFMMGSSSQDPEHQTSESPRHQVKIVRGFALSRSEVTVGQFRRFVQSSGYVPDSVKLHGTSVYDERSGSMRTDHEATWEDDYAGRHAADDLPVVNVSWNDANAYAEWLSQRTGKSYMLPSEAQFAYAMRAGSQQRYWWGDGVPDKPLENVTGSQDRSRRGRRWTHAFSGYRDGYWGPAPVASFAPNAFGLYDMDGNVTEWMRDCWHANYTRAPNDGSAWINPGCSNRVLRGGSWGSSPEQVRSAWRRGAPADTRSGRVGFRVARTL